MLAVVGFATILLVVGSIVSKKVSAMLALLGFPILACLVIGDASHLGEYVVKGVQDMSPTAFMLMFAILFFGLIRDAGVFDPLVNIIVKISKGNAIMVCVGTYMLACVGHLDGAGATTVLLCIPALMPIYDRLNMRRISLVTIIALGAGTMNMLPWGGPTILAATSLGVEPYELFMPMMPGFLMGIASGFVISYIIGRSENKRLIREGLLVSAQDFHADFDVQRDLSDDKRALLRPKMMPVNVLLVVCVMASMFIGLMPPVVVFGCALILAFLINYRHKDLQEALINMHAEDAILTVCVCISAGILSGILTESGMSTAMANAMVSIMPASLGKFLPVLSGILAVPAGFLIDQHVWYVGVVPVLAKAAATYGVSSLALARGWLVGMGTISCMIMPFYGAPILMMGMAKVEFGDVQRFAFKFLWIQSLVVLAGLIISGAIPL